MDQARLNLWAVGMFGLVETEFGAAAEFEGGDPSIVFAWRLTAPRMTILTSHGLSEPAAGVAKTVPPVVRLRFHGLSVVASCFTVSY